MLKLSTPLYELHLHEIPRVAMKTAQKLAQGAAGSIAPADAHHVTVEDLVHYLPMRYEDRSNLARIRDLKDGMWATINAEVRIAGTYAVKSGRLRIFEISAVDGTGQIRAFWWNQAYLQNSFKQGRRVLLYGQWKRSRRGFFEVENPDYEFVLDDDQADPIHTGRRVPVYRKLGEIRTKQLRSIMHHLLERLDVTEMKDVLPQELLARNKLVSKGAALRQVHFPADDAPLDAYNNSQSPAHHRLIFEEFFLLSLAMGLRRQGREQSPKGTVIEVNDRVRNAVREVLPFKPTNAQKRVLGEIVADMTSSKPMNRLLQGDVGSGKTIVAVQAAIVAIENGYQGAIMVPTEILAEQHFVNVSRLLQPSRFRVALLTGSTSAAARREQLAGIATGTIDLVVGTHALVQGDVQFHTLGLVVIDEQHRFGVLQRATLRAKGLHPDVLVMTATPIPRTLALTAYGDLDVSAIRDMPPGRFPVKTLAKPESRRDEVYAFVRGQLDAGRQAYVVYPLVEESAKIDVKAATEMADHLATEVFPAYRVGLLHGRMKADGKDRVMRAFVSGELQILVSTTVVEVGMDVPSATVMIVEHAERFGLSQLHQLRGRVGRDRYQSHCFLMYQSPLSEEARERLRALTETTDGFEIAERDLRLRGPGDFFGTRQAGMPTFRMIDLVRDRELLEAARQEAIAWFDRSGPPAAAVEEMLQSWESRFRLIEIG